MAFVILEGLQRTPFGVIRHLGIILVQIYIILCIGRFFAFADGKTIDVKEWAWKARSPYLANRIYEPPSIFSKQINVFSQTQRNLMFLPFVAHHHI